MFKFSIGGCEELGDGNSQCSQQQCCSVGESCGESLVDWESERCEDIDDGFIATRAMLDKSDIPDMDSLLKLIEMDEVRNLAWWHTNIGHSYCHKFPELSDLRSAETCYCTALKLSNKDNSFYIKHVLSRTLSQLFTRTGFAHELNETIKLGEAALTGQMDNSEYLHSLSIALIRRFETQSLLIYLRRAFEYGELGLAKVPESHSDSAE